MFVAQRWITPSRTPFCFHEFSKGVQIARRSDIRDLAAQAADKIPGSTRYRKLWRHFLQQYSDLIRENLKNNPRFRVDLAETRKLETDLGRVGASMGEMPDFSNTGALRGYTLNHFGRVLLLGDMMALSGPDWLASRMNELLARSISESSCLPCKVASLGGGPGYDFVSTSAFSDYRGGPPTSTVVFDFEPRWQDVVHSVTAEVNNIFQRQKRHTCDYRMCDITQSLESPLNEVLASTTYLRSFQVFTCSYCIAENAKSLRQSNLVFFNQLFREAAEGSLFFFAETTHRLWPDIIDMASMSGNFKIEIPHIRCGKSGWQLILLKDSGRPGTGFRGSSFCGLYDRFSKDNEAHNARLDRGWTRQLLEKSPATRQNKQELIATSTSDRMVQTYC